MMQKMANFLRTRVIRLPAANICWKAKISTETGIWACEMKLNVVVDGTIM